MLDWSKQFSICCFLDNHQYQSIHHSQECLLAVGSHRSYSAAAGDAFEGLENFSKQNPDWLFGHLGYDLKNEIEALQSPQPDRLGFPDLFFFVPQTIVELNDERIKIGSMHDDHQQLFESIVQRQPEKANTAGQMSLTLQSRFSKEEYLFTIGELKKHILRGDCYEINFCQEFFADNTQIDPYAVYERLSQLSPTPFGGFYKLDGSYLLCASPERYLKKTGDTILSQPIKGTSKRDPADALADRIQKEQLQSSPKERSENVMVVDLVRNDLSKIALEGSVTVEELYGVYTFPQVHQMISTVKAILSPGISWSDMIRETFPMGSMTGAPKKRVMELIEQYEKSRRGIFSGAIGYVTPNRDFDFNVVIRSILYNEKDGYLSYQVGSAITFYSDPEKEYEECQLKAAAIKKVLTNDQYP